MIPGVHAYKAMISMVQIHHFGFSDTLFEQMISSFINTSFILGAIVFGLALPGLLFYRQNLWCNTKNSATKKADICRLSTILVIFS